MGTDSPEVGQLYRSPRWRTAVVADIVLPSLPSTSLRESLLSSVRLTQNGKTQGKPGYSVISWKLLLPNRLENRDTLRLRKKSFWIHGFLVSTTLWHWWPANLSQHPEKQTLSKHWSTVFISEQRNTSCMYLISTRKLYSTMMANIMEGAAFSTPAP